MTYNSAQQLVELIETTLTHYAKLSLVPQADVEDDLLDLHTLAVDVAGHMAALEHGVITRLDFPQWDAYAYRVNLQDDAWTIVRERDLDVDAWSITDVAWVPDTDDDDPLFLAGCRYPMAVVLGVVNTWTEARQGT